ncbi:MAG: hypothetical protein JW757_03075 [Anaerolineales bacterium]|nr:hypothetical protein [Anaerolineales bacterium]
MITGKVILLGIHNLLRWAIVISAVFTLYRLYRGWLQKKPWENIDQKAIMVFTIFLDTQLLIGLLLYFIFSDLVKAAFSNMAAAMGNQVLRFFTIEHTLLMIVAIVLSHIAGAVGKKDLPENTKFKRSAALITLALIFLLAGIPWTSRPLLPSF